MALASVILRTVEADDADALAVIENQSFPDPSWTAPDFLKYDCTVAVIDGTPIGFIVSREVYRGNGDTPPEREILNLAVALEFRRFGIGLMLVQHELQHHATVFLEVRESNAPAIQLYRNAGFIEISRRGNYYVTPPESAIVMRMKW